MVQPVRAWSVKLSSTNGRLSTTPARRVNNLSTDAIAQAKVGSLRGYSVLRAANRFQDIWADAWRFLRGRRRCVPGLAIRLIHHGAVVLLIAVAVVPDLLVQRAIAAPDLTADAEIDGGADGRTSSGGGRRDGGEEQGGCEERGAKEHERGLHDWHCFRLALWKWKSSV
jgi:hypothetical protein